MPDAPLAINVIVIVLFAKGVPRRMVAIPSLSASLLIFRLVRQIPVRWPSPLWSGLEI
jgi:hypothetical protein